MEFNVFEHFKGYQRTTQGPMTAEEQGTRFFLAGHMGERIGERVDTVPPAAACRGGTSSAPRRGSRRPCWPSTRSPA